jgi:hypothetical protein
MEMLYLLVPASIMGGMVYLDVRIAINRADNPKKKVIRTQSLPAYWEDR